MQSYHHFTLTEREKLQDLLREKIGIRRIATILGKSPSTISREVSRNRNKDGSYHPWRATVLYIVRRRSSKRTYRFDTDKILRECVCNGLDQYWSPEIITARWKSDHPEEKLSHSSIYAAIKAGRLENYSPKTHFRRRGKRQYPHSTHSVHPEHLIRDWPSEITNRERLGDWEGDTVYGAFKKGFLFTCVDRKSRYLAASLMRTRTSEETNSAAVRALSGQTVRSLSLDNGSEFAGFKELEGRLKTTIYFADPHAPWQRGSNENINGLLRFFFPKGIDFHSVTQQRLNDVLEFINNRPRKCLGWLSPHEFLSKCCT